MNDTPKQPNILFICVDQWRADALGCSGHPVVETPHLDQLASEGTNFTQAYTSVPSCVAARAAIFTGLSQRHHGFVGYNDKAEWKYDVTLPGLLAGAGYHTQCVGKMHVEPPRNLLGFHNVVLHDGYTHLERSKKDDYSLVDDYTPWLRDQLGRSNADYIDTGIGCNGYAARPWVYDEMLHPTSWVTTQSIDFLRRRDTTKPFFLMTSYHRPHPPLDPPQAYLDRYLQKELPEIPRGDWVDFELPPGRFDSPYPKDSAQMDYARRAYYAQLTHIDHQINRLIMSLFEFGVLQDTAIMFVSDHGEMLYDHNHLGKTLAYDGSARVPMMLRLPQGAKNTFKGRELGATVELRDILPTFCELAGVEVPETVDGKSILPLMRGEAEQIRSSLHGEHTRGADSNHWMTDGKEKYIWFAQTGKEQLFDLREDPHEMQELSGTRPERVAFWRSQLVNELEGREEGFVSEGKLVSGRPQNSILLEAGRYVQR